MKKTLLCGLIIMLFIPNHVAGADLEGQYLDLKGNTQDFSDYQGKPLLVEAFATECEHCQDQHEDLSSFYNSYNNSFSLLSLSVSDGDDLEKLKQWSIDFPSSWDIGKDVESNFADTYNIWGTPSFVLFDESGEFMSCSVGRQSEAELKSEMDNFLNDFDNYEPDNEKQCADRSFFQNFLSSIFFPITIVAVLAGGFYLAKRYLTASK